MIVLLEILLYSFMATLFFALIMKASKKSIFYSSFAGAIGYLLYYITDKSGYGIMAFFIGTVASTIICEFLARKLHRPSTTFIFPAIITIVPGLGLYETMARIVEADIESGAYKGAVTFLEIIVMAIAMSVASGIFIMIKNSAARRKEKRIKAKLAKNSSDNSISEENDCEDSNLCNLDCAEEISVNEVIKLIGKAGRMMLENGGETYRAEEICKYICSAYEIEDVEAIAMPIGFFVTVGNGKEDTETTLIKRIKKRSINLDKIDKLVNLSRKISSKKLSVDNALKEINEIENASKLNKVRWWEYTYEGLSAGFFSLLFFGGIVEFICAFIAGLLITITAKYLNKIGSRPFFISLIGGIIITVLALIFNITPLDIDPKTVIISGIMPLLPGLAMTNAIQDAMRGDLISGLARGAEALIIATSLALGVGVVLSLSSAIGYVIA